jgi:3-oxoacyl-[acyl-carrier protein] reductase
MTVPQPLLEGRRILVTGAATGIGAAAVRVLHAAGAHLVATYHRTDPARDAPAVTWLQCDVRDAASVDSAFASAVRELGSLDVLVNAAGSWQPGVPGHITSDEINFLLATNVKATILTNQAAHAVMRGNGLFKPGPVQRPKRGEQSGSPSMRLRPRCRHRVRIGFETSSGPTPPHTSISR